MRPNRNNITTLPGNRRNHTILRPTRVTKCPHTNPRYSRCSHHVLDLLKQPRRRLLAGGALVVAVVEGDEGRELGLHVRRAKFGEEGRDGGFLGNGGGEDGCALGEGGGGGVQVGEFCDVHEVDSGLEHWHVSGCE